MSLIHKVLVVHNWWVSLLLGSTCYALANGLVHVSDWCYLAASTAVAAAVSAGLRPVHGWLVARLPQLLRAWALLWALSCTLAVFGAGVLLTWPLRSWPGPNGLWPWGVGALLATAISHWPRASPALPETGTPAGPPNKPAPAMPISS